MKKVMVFGTFDILHRGHLNFFKQARKYGNYLIIVVARDKTVKGVKGKIPKNNERKRLKKVMRYADKAVLGFIFDKYKVIKKFNPAVICLGYDQKFFVEGLKKLNIAVIRLKQYKAYKYKSSKIRLKNKDQK